MMIGLRDVGKYVHADSVKSIASDINRLQQLISSEYYIEGGDVVHRATEKSVPLKKIFEKYGKEG